MKKKIHINESIFIKNPHVYYVVCTSAMSTTIKSYCHKHLSETWGYTDLVFSPSEFRYDIINNNTRKFKNVYSFFLFFSSEESVLQLKLSHDVDLKKVKMWPSRRFTIHEFLN